MPRRLKKKRPGTVNELRQGGKDLENSRSAAAPEWGIPLGGKTKDERGTKKTKNSTNTKNNKKSKKRRPTRRTSPSQAQKRENNKREEGKI